MMDNAARPGVPSGFLTPCMKKLQRGFLMVNIISVINKAALFKLEGFELHPILPRMPKHFVRFSLF